MEKSKAGRKRVAEEGTLNRTVNREAVGVSPSADGRRLGGQKPKAFDL